MKIKRKNTLVILFTALLLVILVISTYLVVNKKNNYCDGAFKNLEPNYEYSDAEKYISNNIQLSDNQKFSISIRKTSPSLARVCITKAEKADSELFSKEVKFTPIADKIILRLNDLNGDDIKEIMIGENYVYSGAGISYSVISLKNGAFIAQNQFENLFNPVYNKGTNTITTSEKVSVNRYYYGEYAISDTTLTLVKEIDEELFQDSNGITTIRKTYSVDPNGVRTLINDEKVTQPNL